MQEADKKVMLDNILLIMGNTTVNELKNWIFNKFPSDPVLKLMNN